MRSPDHDRDPAVGRCQKGAHEPDHNQQ
jgi:hypothetical protein